MDNLTIFDSLKTVPQTALREIQAGRLKGKSDINPVWRIKALTEQFGPCGIGWKYVITNKHLDSGANGEIAAFVDIDLFVKYNGEWSDPIPGTGGSMFVAKEKSGLYVSDECFKMALTDAISVAGKALGLAASIYWEKGESKYNKPVTVEDAQKTFNSDFTPEDEEYINSQQAPTDTGDKTDIVRAECEACNEQMTQGQMNLSKQKYGKMLCPACQKKEAV